MKDYNIFHILTTGCLFIYYDNRQRASVPNIFIRKAHCDKIGKNKDVPLAEAAPVKLLMLLLCEWDLVQAKLISLQLLLSEKHMDRKNNGIVKAIHMKDLACLQ
jgi:hypothetical protein